MLGTVSLHSCKKVMGGAGVEGLQVLCWVPEMVLPLKRFANFGLGGSAGRPRVPKGGSGGLPELMLGSPKGILDLPGAQFGVSEVRLGVSDSVLLSSRRQRILF